MRSFFAVCLLLLPAAVLAAPGDDLDGDGVQDPIDCDDGDPTRFPGQDEYCDGADVDNDCDAGTSDNNDDDGDGVTVCAGDCDEGDPDRNPLDSDGDGYDGCSLPYDCDDSDAAANWDDADGDGYPTCGADPDCDDLDATANWDDADGDFWSSCDSPADCADGDAVIHPGQPEVCGNAVDEDCTGVIDDIDIDGDGDVSDACGGPDCDDANPVIGPTHGETSLECADGVDNDCDGSIDNADEDCFVAPEVDAGIDQQDQYLGGVLVVAFDGSATRDPNPGDTVSYGWTLADHAYEGVTVELVTDPESPVAWLRFAASASAPDTRWTFTAQLIATDQGGLASAADDEQATATVIITRPESYSSAGAGCGVGARPWASLLLLPLLLRRRR